MSDKVAVLGDGCSSRIRSCVGLSIPFLAVCTLRKDVMGKCWLVKD